MAKFIMVNQKKRGRPATGRDPVSAVRLPAGVSQAVDEWAAANDASRSEAIRRLVELGLTVKPKARPCAESQKQRAKELAAKAIEKMTDAAATDEVKLDRKRRLIKGPEEFRDVRVDRKDSK
jgi:hypothetical protein